MREHQLTPEQRRADPNTASPWSIPALLASQGRNEISINDFTQPDSEETPDAPNELWTTAQSEEAVDGCRRQASVPVRDGSQKALHQAPSRRP